MSHASTPANSQYTPEEAVLLTMKMLRRTNPNAQVLDIVSRIEAQATADAKAHKEHKLKPRKGRRRPRTDA